MFVGSSSSGVDTPPDFVASAIDVLRTTPERAAELVGSNFPRDLQTLSNAEWRVLHFLKLGMSNKEIASALARSEATVKNQIASVLRKLCVPSRARLLALLWCAELLFAHESLSFRGPQPSARSSGHSTHQRQPQKITPRCDLVAT